MDPTHTVAHVECFLPTPDRRRPARWPGPTRSIVAAAALFLSMTSHGCGTVDEQLLAGVEEGYDADLGSSTEAIVGGTVFTDLPAVGMVVYGRNPKCTGTLISPRRVLTAAHCFVGTGGNYLSFQIGPRADQVEHRIEIVEVHAHPQFNPATLLNDIAYAVLDRDAPVEPLGVVTHMDRSWLGRSLLFVGYGYSNGVTHTGRGTKRAMSTQIDRLDTTTFRYNDTRRQTCGGDSGGPALYRDSRGAYLVAGVTSGGDRQCRIFGVSTRVDPFTAFITPSNQPPPDAGTDDSCNERTFGLQCEEDVLSMCVDGAIRTVGRRELLELLERE